MGAPREVAAGGDPAEGPQVGGALGVFHSPIASDNGRVAAPSFGNQDGVDYMFYEAGQRLKARICIARAV
ncbi:hypothetical protein [Streptosporangium minutum]|uniref:Uncharacterized protein n=1 Tax=Streptosporangium minutum TaxID=569862 RepID=A0A243RH11_9ACTN|nr:hypothetical protein [Streptosporangium minutum]OUC94045.1 hypothetical protein CA984_24055 [Streptosporangium minutum]